MEDEGRTLGRGRDGGTHVDIVAKGHITSGLKERSTLQATRGPIVQGNAAQETGRGLIGPTAGGDSSPRPWKQASSLAVEPQGEGE